MKQNFKKAGRPHKVDPTAFRCSVNFTASEQAAVQTMHEKSGVESLSAFIKMQIFGKTFKVHYIDDATREFIDRLSSLNARYRTLAIDYDIIVKTLRENFTDKKAMKALYRLEQATIEMVKVNREIVALAREFDERWLQKSNNR
ncbi:MobA protein [Bacteroides acidifaciens]|uniref:plasmid mobilization protein n=1 Tax=Bacteroides acidifaciens TaxID=85831 RepID=UPI0025B01111|nr:MobA protein [uncultured Duncaniella sp.]